MSDTPIRWLGSGSNCRYECIACGERATDHYWANSDRTECTTEFIRAVS